MHKTLLQTSLNKRSQYGAALILLFLALLMTGTIFFVASIAIDKSRIQAEETTSGALAKAKKALIAYSTSFAYTETQATNLPRSGLIGFLPCPETATSGEGQAAGNCGNQYTSFLGKLPWKDLGLEPLKDSAGQCLWYAVSSEFKNGGALDPGAGFSRTEMLNDDSNGSFVLYDEDGSTILHGSTPEDRVVAVVIAPGSPINGQVRATVAGTTCGGNYDANQYLELFNGRDNRSITTSSDFVDDFITSKTASNSGLNDRFVTITAGEIFDAVRRDANFRTLMSQTTEALAECVAAFGANNLQPPPGGGGGICPGGSRNACRNMCDDTWRSCGDQCDADRAACIAAGGRPNVCNAQRNTCNDQCRDARAACRDNCDINCATGGGGGGNDFRLPWPAAVNLAGADYRIDDNYIEVADTWRGRLPFDVTLASNITSNQIAITDLLEKTYCNNLTVTGVAANIDLTNDANIYRRLWRNWKDHFFYVLGDDFDLSGINTPATCTNCLTSNGSTDRFAAMVIFSGERLAARNQRRLASPPEAAAPVFADSKADISNYLEGNNVTNNPNGTGDYMTGSVNDVAFCIQEDMTVIPCP